MNGASTVCDLVIDGNSFWTTEPNRIRLANVFAPEEGEPGYEEAKNSLKRLIQSRFIEYKPLGTSSNFIIAEVFVDGKSVNQQMRLEGYNIS
jgi:endonuclease YncB( thermonuclease family)